jgi:hypothetical protein
MEDMLTTWWREIADRPGGPFAVRFYVQPLMATGFAIRDGLRDARAGRPAYFWSLLTDPAHRGESLRSGWRSVGKIFFIALGLDLVYQLGVMKALRPVQGIFMAIALAIVPYVLLRGPVTRIARRVRGPGRPHERPA